MAQNPTEQVKDNLEIEPQDQAKKLDTRRARLTLEHLNKLRKMRELRLLQQKKEQGLYKVMYARPQA